MTNPRIVSPPFTMTEAWEQVAEWLNVSSVWIPEPTENHASIFGRLLKAAGANSNLVPDVHLAALAIEHGLTLCSADRDFGRFPDLRWRNPLNP